MTMAACPRFLARRCIALCLLLLVVPAFAVADSGEQAMRAAVAATVRINARRDLEAAVGSGVVVGRSERGVYIVTANHVVDDADEVTVECIASDRAGRAVAYALSGSAEVLARSSSSDMALLRVRTSDSITGMLRINPADRTVSAGMKVYFYGFVSGTKPLLVQTTAIEHQGMRGAGYWLTGKSPLQGQSGGPLVDAEGYLVGICSAAVSDGTGLFGDDRAIRELCDAAGASFLHRKSASGYGSKPPLVAQNGARQPEKRSPSPGRGQTPSPPSGVTIGSGDSRSVVIRNGDQVRVEVRGNGGSVQVYSSGGASSRVEVRINGQQVYVGR